MCEGFVKTASSFVFSQKFPAVCVTRASTVRKRHMHRSFPSGKQPVIQTRAHRDGERRVSATEFPLIFVVFDIFATGIVIGNYLGRKSK